LAWVKDNEPELFAKIDKIMLPGDYIAMRLSGEIGMTIEGLSEGIFWDFKNNCISDDVINYYGIPKSFFLKLFLRSGFRQQFLQLQQELGLKEGTPISYRAGDQPNNALSLNVFNPGEIASTAGTSGVVYGVLDKLDYDKFSRVNTFAHVNYTEELTRLGVLLCINGTGILNSWLKHNFATSLASYGDMNDMASLSPIGSKLSIIPFGNGAERVLENKDTSCSIHGINL
jgi:xylulokinase